MSDPQQVRVLLVDDRPENVLAYQATLGEMQIELIAVRSGADALKQVLLHDFAVILLDVNMPIMDGFETAKLIRTRKRSAHTPIIFLTAFPDEFQAIEGYAHGAVDYLLTPAVPDVLRAKVKVFVELFRMTEQVKRQTEERIALAQERAKRAAVEESNRRLSFLTAVTSVVGQSLDDAMTIRDVLGLVVPALADEAAIAEPADDGGRWRITEASCRAGNLEVLQPDSFDQLPAPLAQAMRDAWTSGGMTSTARAEAAGAGADTVAFPLRAQQATLAVFALSRDASGRRFSEADLALAEAVAARAAIALENARLYKDLEQADRQKNEFLSMLAHELRNPLAPIRTAVDVLRLRVADQPEVGWARDIIDRQLTHLVRLVDDLLDVSRITGGKIRLNIERCEVSSIVAAAVETSRPLIEAAEHEFSVCLPDEPMWLDCDRVRLAQVLANLLNNAAKYTHRGGKIELALRREGDEAVFRVVDNGIGVSREMLTKVFDLFTQVDRSLDRSQGGLGVGLTLVRKLVELHGGRVEAASDGAGRGSEFIVRLPVGAGVSPPVSPPLPRADRRSPGRVSVLVVDDNADAANSLALLLQYKGHDVRTAHDGESALELAAIFRPQVVLLDLGLPELDGYEVARRMRAARETRAAQLIAISGYGQEEHRRRCFDAGFDRHFVKPIDVETLMRAVAETGVPADPAVESAVPGS
jgi:signal transduction histidine kinase/DNA-binding response OmpR family regulator